MSFQFREQFKQESMGRGFVTLAQAGIYNPEYQALIAASDDPVGLARALLIFLETGEITAANQALLVAHPNPSGLADVLGMLRRNQLLTAAYQQLLLAHPHCVVLAKELNVLHAASILTAENCALIIQHPQPTDLGWLLVELSKASLLTAAHRHLLRHYSSPTQLTRGVSTLATAGIFTEFNFSLLLQHPTPSLIAMMFWCMSEIGVLIPACQTAVMSYHDILGLVEFCWNFQHIGIQFNPENFSDLLRHTSVSKLVSVFKQMQQARILSQHSFDMVLRAADFERMVAMVSILNQAKLISDDNLVQLVEHLYPKDLYRILAAMLHGGILIQENFVLAVEVLDCEDFSKALTLLARHGLLNQANFNSIYSHPHFYETLAALENAGIGTPENCLLADANKDLYNWQIVVYQLGAHDLLNQDNFVFCVDYPQINLIHEGVSELVNEDLLDAQNFALICAHINPHLMGNALGALKLAGLLSAEHIATIAAFPFPDDLAHAMASLNGSHLLTVDNIRQLLAFNAGHHSLLGLDCLSDAEILTQANFNILMEPQHQFLLTQEVDNIVWTRLPLIMLNQENFARLIAALGADNPALALRQVVDALIQLQPEAQIVLNDDQSTHTASVHRSVSASALKLKDIYKDSFVLSDKLSEIKTEILTLESSPKNDAAKRGIEWLLSARFSDSSGVTLPQLLALAYVAIHDETRRTGSLADAKTLYVEGLYEIQRGYNITMTGNDNGAADLPICLAGSFNKIIEKLMGIHLAVEVYFITHAGAMLKLPKLAKQHAYLYLSSKANPSTIEDYQRCLELCTQLRGDGSLERIWSAISSTIEAELWDEFAEAYGHSKDNERFVELMAYGREISIPDLSSIEAQLQDSEGYRLYMASRVTMGVAGQGIFANTIPSDEEDEVQAQKRQRT